MRTEGTILLTNHHHAPVGCPINRYLISDKPIDDLIENLHKNGIEISPDYSYKDVRYVKKHGELGDFVCEEKTVTVPLETKFPMDVTPMVFYLSDGKTLKLEFRNYSNITKSPNKGVVGGSLSGDFGIACSLTLDGTDIDESIVDKVREAMKTTYETS